MKHLKKPLSSLLSLLLILSCVSVFCPVLPATAEEHSLTLDKTEYAVGEPILCTATGSDKDWVGIYRRADTVASSAEGGVASIYWYYVVRDSFPSGSTCNIQTDADINTFRPDTELTAGEYKAVLLENDGYTILAQVDFVITDGKGTEPTEPTDEVYVRTDKTEYFVGEDILVTATGTAHDWIGLYLEDDIAAPQAQGGVSSIYWYYVAADGNTSGSTKSIRQAEYSNGDRSAYFTIPAGQYKLLLLKDDGYEVLAETHITVRTDPSGAPDAPSSASLKRTNTIPGFAEGTLTVRLSTEVEQPAGYVVYWGDANGKLSDFTPLSQFACKGFVTEYAVPANTMIPAGADRMLVYAVSESGVASRNAVTVPLTGMGASLGEPVAELQIMSDIHINTEDSHLHNRHFAAALADILAISPDSIGIFVNGDIADHGQAAEYEALNRLIRDAGENLPPVYCAIGNHDLSGGGSAAAQIQQFLTGTGNTSETVYFDTWIAGIHFIFLGGEQAGIHADLSAAQLQWLESKLAENRDENRPIFVFLHQGLMDTVAGTFEYQDWHGVEQSAQLSAILSQYPEVILSSGHSHWTLESAHTFKAFDDSLPTILNTASCAYLWDDSCIATNEGIVGSEGWYVTVYENMLVVRGRDYVNGLWIGSAQFIMKLHEQAEEETQPETTDAPDPVTEPDESDGTDAPENTGTEPVTTPATQNATVADTTAEAGEKQTAGCQSALALSGMGVLTALLGGAVALTVFHTRGRKRKD